MLAFDLHLDLAMNALEWNRDLRLPVAELRPGRWAMLHAAAAVVISTFDPPSPMCAASANHSRKASQLSASPSHPGPYSARKANQVASSYCGSLAFMPRP